MDGLITYPRVIGLPEKEVDQVATLTSCGVARVICFALGPEGTNIAQATREWVDRMRIARKAEIILRLTPEECLAAARNVTEKGVVAIFVTCAVFARESHLFFQNPDVLPFFSQQTMLLDAMQLATRSELAPQVNGSLPSGWRIASHPSPQHLVTGLDREIVIVESNAAAAEHCQLGQSHACVTTESARKRCGLVRLHEFGSPPMVFFFGITAHGAKVIGHAYRAVQVDASDPPGTSWSAWM